MKLLKRLRIFIKTTDDDLAIKYKSFFWNSMYSGLNAFQPAIFLFAIARTQALGEAGIVTTGFAIANLVMILAGYVIRNYQVTDVGEEFSFSDYFFVRVITVFGSLILSWIYLAAMVLNIKYSIHKALVIFMIIAMKMIDTMESVYVGRLQQKGRLDIGARLSAVRVLIVTIIVFIALYKIRDIAICFLIGVLVSTGIDMYALPVGREYADFKISKMVESRIRRLLVIAFPLCVGSVLHNYLGNAPKYIVDIYLTDEMQAICGYIMMPMFVVTMLNLFLMQPAIKGLADLWYAGDMNGIKKTVLRHILIIIILAILVLFVGLLMGLNILSMLYRVDLMEYRRAFVCFMFGGTLYTLSAYFMVLLTVARQRKIIVIAGICSAFVYLPSISLWIVRDGNIMRVAISYVVSNLVLLAVFIMGLFCVRYVNVK